MRWLLAAASAVALTASAAAGAEPAGANAPAPPAARPSASAAAPTPPPPYDTPGLRPGRSSFTSNSELHDALQALSTGAAGATAALAQPPATPGTPDLPAPAATPDAPPRLLQVGLSAGGEPLLALHFSRGPGRPAVLLQGQQHGDEPAGSEALLALSQQLAGGALAQVLQRIDVVVLPRVNPDGAALGRRAGLLGLDINRDHLLLRTPEARALARLVLQLDPLLVVDAHEHPAAGADGQRANPDLPPGLAPGLAFVLNAQPPSDLMFQYATTANMPPALSQASEQWFHQPLLQAMAAQGLRTDWYTTAAVNPAVPGDTRLVMGSAQPDTARNALGLQNRIAILLETQGVGTGRQDIQRRVHSQVVALTSLLHSAAEHADDLLALRRQVQAQVAASACQASVVVLAAQTPGRRELPLPGPLTGTDRRAPVLWSSSLQLRPLVTRTRPCGYWLAATAHDAVQRLQQLGVQLWQLPAATDLPAELWRETAVIDSGGQDRRGSVADGDVLRLVQVSTDAQRLQAPAGSWLVPLDQPLANLAVAVLEPDAPHSWFAHGVLPALDSAARVMAPVMPPVLTPEMAPAIP